MKKIIFIFLVVFITEVRSTETIYNTDLITINSLEYDKTRLIVFKPCILNKYIITNDKKNSELDNLIDNIGQEYIDNNVYKSTNKTEEITIRDMYSYYEDKNISDNEENNTEEQENDSINTKLDNNNNLEAQNQKEKTELVEENLRNKDC